MKNGWFLLRVATMAVLALGYAWIAFEAGTSGHPGLLGLAGAFGPVLAVLLALAWTSRHRVLALGAWAALTFLLAAYKTVLFQHYAWAYLAQHAGTMLSLAWMFGRTLIPGQQPLVARLSESVHGPLTSALARYTRGVTIAWTLLFATMGVISLGLFLWASPTVWSLFADLLTTPIMMAMFLGEYIVRRRVLPRGECPSARDTFRACYTHMLGTAPSAGKLPPASGSRGH